jgi:hypothetical protein
LQAGSHYNESFDFPTYFGALILTTKLARSSQAEAEAMTMPCSRRTKDFSRVVPLYQAAAQLLAVELH